MTNLLKTKFVVFQKQGFTYVANVESMDVLCYTTYDNARQYLTLMMQCRLIAYGGGAEFWGK